jgi:hypothetical protein
VDQHRLGHRDGVVECERADQPRRGVVDRGKLLAPIWRASSRATRAKQNARKFWEDSGSAAALDGGQIRKRYLFSNFADRLAMKAAMPSF